MKNNSKIIMTLIVSTLPLSGCLSDNPGAKSLKGKALPAQQVGTQPPSNIGGEPPPGGNNTGNPADNIGIAGVPGASVPTGQAIATRIQNGLKNNAVVTARNFQTVFNQLGSNLPRETNPNRATGFDQIPLLAYAACSDVPLAAYGISANQTLAQNRNALIAAGRNILDMHTGGLASTGPMAAGVTTILSELVDKNAVIPRETVQQSFISVCMTASVFGANMMGF